MSTATTIPLDLAPYATFDAEELAAADRMEALYNQQRATTLALADEKRGHSVRGATDDSLARLAKVYSRQIEDGLPQKRERLVRAQLLDIEREQEFRAALAESWLAAEDGTHCYSAFHGRGGLAAVLHGDARPASYDLAILLDWEHWKRGLVHVLEWGDR